MAAGKDGGRTSSLRHLLNAVSLGHSLDVREVVHGHLNENKLWNPEKNFRVPWSSAVNSKAKHDLHNSGEISTRLHSVNKSNTDMKDDLTSFMLGTSGHVAMLRKDVCSSPEGSSSSRYCLDQEDNAVKSRASKTAYSEVLESNSIAKVPIVSHPICSSPEHDLRPLLITMPRKFSQYKEHMSLQKDIKNIAGNQNLSGEKEIGYLKLEENLLKRLHFLHKRHRHTKQPNFYRLQAFDDSWAGVIKHSTPPLANELQMIKEVYDGYVTALLDAQVSTDVLYDTLNSLPAECSENEKLIQREHAEIEKLTARGNFYIKENERLKAEIDKPLVKEPEKEPNVKKKNQGPVRHEKPRDLEDKVFRLHSQIDETYDDIDVTMKERKMWVPASVCESLRLDSKEMELSIQRLCRQNEYLERKVETLEEEVEDLLNAAQSSEGEKRGLWRKINTSNVVKMGT